MKDRNHEYIYTVGVRTVTTVKLLDKNGDDTGRTEEVTTWPLQEVHAFNIHQVAGKLHKELDDIRYEKKVIC